MMRYSARALACLLVASSTAATSISAMAQSTPAPPAGATVRDILNRAQTEAERRSVEDLIGRLRSGTPATGTKSSPPGTATRTPDLPPAAVPTGLPAATAPGVTPPPVATPPLAPVNASVPAPPSNPQASATPAQPTTRAALPSDATVRAPPAAASIGGPGSVTPVPPATPGIDGTATDATATARTGESSTPPAAPLSSPTAPVGHPIGPDAVFPKPAGLSDAAMQKAPDIAAAKGLPSVDVEVLFDYDTAAITPAAAESLRTLGRALADPRLASGKFVIAGHTDARGRDTYNLALSQRRADAVRLFLIRNFKLDPQSLVARGFGETRLKNRAEPFAPENRRVQVINWTSEVVGKTQ